MAAITRYGQTRPSQEFTDSSVDEAFRVRDDKSQAEAKPTLRELVTDLFRKQYGFIPIIDSDDVNFDLPPDSERCRADWELSGVIHQVQDPKEPSRAVALLLPVEYKIYIDLIPLTHQFAYVIDFIEPEDSKHSRSRNNPCCNLL